MTTDPPTSPPKRRLRRPRWLAPLRRWVVASVVLLLVGGVILLGITDPFASPGGSHPGTNNADPTGLQAVTRQNLSSQTQVSATLGYAGSYSIVNQAQGTVTSLPTVGQVVSQGQVLYEVSGTPIMLLYGTTPAYRSLSEGMTGADVEELNADLVTFGYVTSTVLSPTSDEFSYQTEVGVEKLQKVLGVTDNGTLTLGQALFEPSAVRVTSVSATLGASAQAGQPVLSVTSTTRQVSVALDASNQSEVAVGDKVNITLPNNETTQGLISSVGTVATTPAGGGNPTITVQVKPSDPAATGSWDEAPVSVTITTASVTNALVVPVDALLAQPDGSYAVEVAGAYGTHHLVTVSLGLFDDAAGRVQVTNTGLAVGERVVVPKV